MTKRPSIDDYVTIHDAVNMTGIPRSTVYYWIKIGELNFELLGKTKIILKRDIKNLLKSLT